jgi:hypothetical protein
VANLETQAGGHARLPHSRYFRHTNWGSREPPLYVIDCSFTVAHTLFDKEFNYDGYKPAHRCAGR